MTQHAAARQRGGVATGWCGYADVILMLYRDKIYNEDTPDPGIVEIRIAREPDGSNSTILMNFSNEHGGFGSR